MSIHDSNNKTLQDGNGTQTIFEFTFKIFKDTDLKVYKVDKETGEMGTPLELNRDYSVTINKVGEGGKVIFTEAPTELQQAGIYRDIAITQPASIPVDTEYVEKTLENALDRSCMIDQQQQEQINRCIQLPAFSNGNIPEPGAPSYDDVEVELPVPKAENVLAWDSEGKALTNYDVKQEIADFEDAVDLRITNAVSDFQGQINTFTSEFVADLNEYKSSVDSDLTAYKNTVNTEMTTFQQEINTTISEVSEAAAKINELEEAVQTAVDNAEIATTKATAAETAANNASEQVTLATAQADRAQDIADEMSANYNALTDFKDSFPLAQDLTTWARLSDGEIHNIPFDDVKADTNRFIAFENGTSRRSLRFKKNTFIKLITSTDTLHFALMDDDIVINAEEYLDEGTNLINGKDYSIFLVPDETNGIAVKISLNKTAPTGYTPEDTRRIGGFHTECVDVGTIAGHPLSGWLAGDIIPSSVWTLWHKPNVASPSGMYYHQKLDIWRPIYVQSGTMENTVFEYNATVTRSRSGWDHEVDLGLVGLEFATSTQFTIASLGVQPLKAVMGKAESSCTRAGGWVDETGRRMITNEGEESTCGGLWEILRDFAAVGGSNWTTTGVNTLTQPRQYGSINRLIGGGAWYDSGYCGPSSRAGNRPAADTAAHVSARGCSRPLRARM